MKCRFCGRDCKNIQSLNGHESQCSSNPNSVWTPELRERISQKMKELSLFVDHGNTILCSCVLCNKQLVSKQLDKHYNSKSCARIKHKPDTNKLEPCVYCNKVPRSDMEYHLSICRKNKKGPIEWTDERRQRFSERMKIAVRSNPDSYSKNNVCGRVKIYEYNGVKLKGKWELEFAKWLDKMGIIWESECNPQPYFWNNSWHMYFPDFYLRDHNIYVEVKGFKRDRDIAKWKQFEGDLIIVDKDVISILNELQSLDVLIENYKFLHL